MWLEHASTDDLHAEHYHLMGADLRRWDDAIVKLQQVGFDPTLPTFVLSECVLI